MRKSRILRSLPSVALISLILGLLEALAKSGLVNQFLMPVPSRIAVTLGQIVSSGDFVGPLGNTLLLLAVGYAIACLAGVTLGLLMGYYPAVHNLFEPGLELLRPIPKPALLPAIMLLLGLGFEMKVATVALGAFFPIWIASLQGARSVDATLIEVARTFGHNSYQILREVILPASAPMIFSGMKVSLGLGMVLVILAEMLANTGGLGAEIIKMQRSFRLSDMYAWIVILSAVGLTLVSLFNWIERRLCFWNSRPENA